MKKIFYLSSLLFSQFVFGTNYYVSTAGNDANNGTSTTTAWKTIGKINSFNFNSNDVIYFRRGDTFYGGIVVRRSSISFDAYGTGEKPIISGLSTVTGWVNLGGNIWEAPVTNVKNGVNLVLRNGSIQQVGRFPNADAANGGYLTYTASSTSSITGPALSSSINWTGAEVAIRINRWDIRRQIVTSHSAGVVTFASNAEIPRVNYGYFFQRDSRTLDKDGEWWHDASNKKLRMYFSSNNPAQFNIQISTVDTLINSVYGNFYVKNLAFTGSGKYGIFARGGSNINITSCDTYNSGSQAITSLSATNVTIDNCTTKNTLGTAIYVINIGTGNKNLFITNCKVDSTALFGGMENDDGGGGGIICRGGDNINVLNNIVSNSGYSAIKWQGNYVNVKYNFINTFCSVRDDGGGIYTVENGGSTLPLRTNRYVVGNIILNGIGANMGSDDKNGSSARGLYCDLGTRNVVLDSNTVANVIGSGMHGNNNASLTYTNNVFYNTGKTYSLQRYPDANYVRNMVIKKNILYPYKFEYRNLGMNVPSLITKEADILAMGVIDSNYYSLRTGIDSSLMAITTNADRTNYKETYDNFSYLTGIIGIEKKSILVPNTGTLEYNASSSPKVISFPGLSKKDVQGNIYNNSVTIPAWGSKVLLSNGTATITPNKIPTVNAGINQTITLPQNSTTLTGTATDSDGIIISYAWTKISGPATGTISTPDSARTIINNLVEGIYQYALNVTDNNGGVGKDTLTITVTATGTGNLLPAVNPSNTINGLDYKYYEGDWSVLPTFNALTAIKSGTTSNFNLTLANRATQYGFVFTGFINVPADGIYTFYTSSDDGSSLYIDNVLTVNNDGIHAAIEKSGTIGLKAGFHAIEGLFFQQASGSAFTVSYQSSTIAKQTIPVTSLFRINKTPVVNAGSNQTITLPASSVTLTGTASDTDGTISSYAWAKISGPASGTIVSPNSASTVINSLTSGIYQFVLNVTDNNSGVGNDTVTVTVNAAATGTLLPAVNLTNTVNGLDYKYYEGNWTVLPSFNTLTPIKTGIVANFDITPANRTTQYGFSFTGFINVPADGIYTFYISSDDGSNLYIDDSLIINHDGVHSTSEKSGTIGLKAGFHAIEGLYFQQAGGATFSVSYQSSTIAKQTIPVAALYRINKTPVVNAGSNQIITLPTSSVTLTGTASDPDGTIVSYSWSKISGPSSGTIVSPNSAGTVTNNLTAGIYQFVLGVTDNNSGVGKDTVTITVNAAAASTLLPAVNLTNNVNGLDYKYYEGSWTVLPSFSTLTPIKTGTIANFGITPANRSTQYGFTFTGFITVPADGIYTFYITSDDGSSLSIDDSLIITHDGVHGATEKSGTVGLKAGFHAIEGLYFQQAGGATFSGSYQSSTISKQTIPSASLYRINKTPVVNAGSNQTITLPTSSVALTGTANDTDGTISSYVWSKISGPASGTIVTPNTANTTINSLTEGLYEYMLSVTDNNGGIGKDTVTITVNEAGSTLLPAVNPANTVTGLDYKYYEGNWTVLPSFTILSPIKTGTVANFSLTAANRSLQYGFSFTGYINVPADGQYTFYTTSDDGSNLYIDNVLTVNNDGVHGAIEKSGIIGLKAGKHAITGLFFQQAGGATFTVSYQSSTITKQTIPSSQLYRISPPIAGRTMGGNSVTIPTTTQLNIVNDPTTLKISSAPNPSNYEFRLFVEGGSSEKIEILVMDIYGKSVFKSVGTTNNSYKFGNKFLPGIYVVKVIQGNTIKLTKVIKL